jgi:hypothetical protein
VPGQLPDPLILPRIHTDTCNICANTHKYKTLLVFAVCEDGANPQLGLRMVAHGHTEKALDSQTGFSGGSHNPQDTSGHQTLQPLKKILYSCKTHHTVM